jgi:uncharacterized spore protein YtfJ
MIEGIEVTRVGVAICGAGVSCGGAETGTRGTGTGTAVGTLVSPVMVFWWCCCSTTRVVKTPSRATAPVATTSRYFVDCIQ